MDFAIEISQAAAREINRIKLARNQPDSRLRLKVDRGGCSGLFYGLELESRASERQKEGEHYFQSNEIAIVIDSHSYSYLNGIKLDYAEDLMGGGFRFQNPQAHNVCGCGISFSLATESPD